MLAKDYIRQLIHLQETERAIAALKEIARGHSVAFKKQLDEIARQYRKRKPQSPEEKSALHDELLGMAESLPDTVDIPAKRQRSKNRSLINLLLKRKKWIALSIIALLAAYYAYLYTQPKEGIRVNVEVVASEMRFINRSNSTIKISELFESVNLSNFSEVLIPADTLMMYAGLENDGKPQPVPGLLKLRPIPENEHRLLFEKVSFQHLAIKKNSYLTLSIPEEVSASKNAINIDISGQSASGQLIFQDSLVFYGQFIQLLREGQEVPEEVLAMEGTIWVEKGKAYPIDFMSGPRRLSIDLEPEAELKNLLSEQMIFIDSVLFKRADGSLKPESSILDGEIEFVNEQGEPYQTIGLEPKGHISLKGYEQLQIVSMRVDNSELNIRLAGEAGLVFKGPDEHGLALQNPSRLLWLWFNRPLELGAPLLLAILLIGGLLIPAPVEEKSLKILFLASNPSTTAKLQLEKEFARISRQVQDNQFRFQLVSEWAVTVDDLQKVMLLHKPYIVHFSGHGTREQYTDEKEGRALVSRKKSSGGIVLSGNDGKEQLVGSEALSQLFAIFTRQFDIQAVVLNACYSEGQAKAIRQHVPYVVGMNRSISDQAAIEFSNGFYLGVSRENDIELGFELAKNKILLEGYQGEDIPVLLKKELLQIR